MSLSRSFLVLGFCAFVTACGFSPLYGTKGTDDIIAEFSDIQIAPIKDRVGQLLTNELKHLLNPLREPRQPRFRLISEISESTASLAVKKSALATRAILSSTVDYTLIATNTGQLLTKGSNNITVGYNLYSADYATLAAEKDARQRAVKELAQDIRLQLGAYFKQTINSQPAQ